MDFVRRYFPDEIQRFPGPPTAGMWDETGTEIEFPPEAWKEDNDNILETICGSGFAVAICQLLGIPPRWEQMVNVMPLYDCQLKYEFGLTIGTNYLGIPPPDKVAELQRLIDTVEPDARLMWYLDEADWRWRRVVPPQSKTSE